MMDTADQSLPKDGSRRTASPSAAEAVDFEARLESALEELDRKRVARRGEFISRIAVAVLGVGALLVVSGLAMAGTLGTGLRGLNFLIYAFPPFAAAGVLGYWASLPRRRYVSIYQEQVPSAVARALGDFHYDAVGKIVPQRLAGSTLLPPHGEYDSGNMFVGHYKGVEVALAEVRLTWKQGGGGGRGTTTAFRGAFRGFFALLSVQRTVSGTTVVNRDAGAAVNWLGGTFGGLERIEMKDPAFDNRFEVYTSDRAEARHLLTPVLIERLTALASHFGGGRLQAAFYENQLFIVVPTAEDLLKRPSIFTGMFEDAGVTRIAGEFRDILSMIDELALDEWAVR